MMKKKIYFEDKILVTFVGLVKIESVFFNNKDNKNNIIYYPQVFLVESIMYY